MSVVGTNMFEDLVGRSEQRAPAADIAEAVRGRRVLVTGAGGSIGSEVVRLAVETGAERVWAVDASEGALFDLGLDGPVEPACVNIQDGPALRALMQTAWPHLVVHAAAYKHVGLMEAQPRAAFKNNVLGTLSVAEAASAAGVADLVHVSTDKALDPVGVMGATKRLAERVVAAVAGSGGPTACVSIRLGNVFGSSGSVVPAFDAQIAAGGPLLLTHPGMQRYFVTAGEAADAVLRCVVLAGAGDVCEVTAGEQVSIADLAARMIRRSGRDVEIEITGPAAGERLVERFTGGPVALAGPPALHLAAQDGRDAALLESVRLLGSICDGGSDEAAMRRELASLEPDYRRVRQGVQEEPTAG